MKGRMFAAVLTALFLTLLLADPAMALGPHTFELAEGEFGSFVEISGSSVLCYDGFGLICGVSDSVGVSASYLFSLSLGVSYRFSSVWLLDGAIGFGAGFSLPRSRLACLCLGGRGASAYALGVGIAYDEEYLSGVQPYLEAELNMRGAYLQVFYLPGPQEFGTSLGLSTSF